MKRIFLGMTGLTLLSVALVYRILRPAPTAGAAAVAFVLEMEAQLQQHPRLEDTLRLVAAAPVQFFTDRDGLRTAYRVLHPAAEVQDGRPWLLIHPGYGQAGLMYGEWVDLALSHGFSVLLVDPLGQGASSKLQERNDAGYIDRFDRYLDGLRGVMTAAGLVAGGDTTVYGLAHSMGAAIVGAVAVDDPRLFRKLVLVAPMLQIRTLGLPHTVALTLARLASGLGLGHLYAPSTGPWDAAPAGFPTSRSALRSYLHWRLQHNDPQYRVGGASFQWVAEALQGSAELRGKFAQLRTPTLILAAEKDRLIETSSYAAVCSLSPVCHLDVVPESRHEILLAPDDEVARLAKRIFSYYQP